MGNAFFQLVPAIVIGLLFAAGNTFLASKTGRSRALWFVLSVIPGVNMIATWYLIYVSIAYAIDAAKR